MPYVSMINTLFRGTLYTIKKLCSTIFLLCLGILSSFVIKLVIENSDNKADATAAFATAIFILLASSAIGWLIARPLHRRSVEKKHRELVSQIMSQLHTEGYVNTETIERIKVRLQQM